MLRGGIIGAGNVALRGHIPAWLACKEVLLTCAADTRCEARAQLDGVLPGRTWYESAEALLESEPLDFVDVCTPPATHGEVIRSALRRGVHVLCEKPLVLDSGEMEELRGLAESRRLVLAAVHNWRYAPILAEATALVRAGAIGSVRRCRWEVLRERPSAAAQTGGLPNWRLDPALSGGGILVDHGWHAAYVVPDWISGALSAVAARLETRRHPESRVEDTADVLLEFEGGEANLFLTWAAEERRNRVEIEGSRGRIRIDGGRLELEGDGSGRTGRREFAESLSDGSHHPGWFQGVASGFLDAVASPGRSSPSAAEAALCLEVILLAQESSRRGGERVPAPAEARAGNPRMTSSGAVSATLWVPAPPADTAAMSVLGLPLPRRTALAAGRAGFARIFFEAGSGGDLREILSGTPAEIVAPGQPPPQLTPGRLVLLAPGVIPQVPWLQSLLARPFEAGTFLFDVPGGAAAVLDAARAEDLARVLADARRSGLPEACAVVYSAGVPLSRPADAFVVRGPADLPCAERWLLQSLIKDSEGFFSRHFERRISLALTRRLVRTPITPNAMTLVSVFVGLVGAALFLSPTAAFQFAGALLFLLHSILDGSDGELARVKFAESRFGGVLDYWGDNVVHCAVFGCLAVGWSRAAGDPRPLLAGAAAIAGALLSAGFVYRHAMGEVREGPQFTSVTNAPATRFSRLADALARRDFIYVLILLSAFGKGHWFLALMAVGAPLFFLLLVAIEASGRRLGRSLS